MADPAPGSLSPTFSIDRRRLLAGTGALATAGLAGCLGIGGESSEDSGTGGGSGDTLPAPVRGDPEADVTVQAFEDFACPHCRTYSLEVVPRLGAEYIEPGQIRYEFHDFPIPVDQTVSWQAASAARAVQATGGDGAFWTYEHALFENQRRLGPGVYRDLADEMELDGGAVRRAAVDEQYRGTVESDRERGIDMGVRGTPTVFVNGQAVDPTYDAVSSAIESALSG